MSFTWSLVSVDVKESRSFKTSIYKICCDLIEEPSELEGLKRLYYMLTKCLYYIYTKGSSESLLGVAKSELDRG